LARFAGPAEVAQRDRNAIVGNRIIRIEDEPPPKRLNRGAQLPIAVASRPK
jgi:hypothetical protein